MSFVIIYTIIILLFIAIYNNLRLKEIPFLKNIIILKC